MSRFKTLAVWCGLTLAVILIVISFLTIRRPATTLTTEAVEQRAEVLGSSSDFFSEGIASADTTEKSNSIERAIDNNDESYWNSTDTTFPHWWMYDLGEGKAKIARTIYLLTSSDQLRDWKLQGSNDDSDWTDLLSRSETKGASPVTVEFENSAAYRYYRVYFSSSYLGRYNNIFEVQLFE